MSCTRALRARPASSKNCQLLPTIGRRAGNIPASDPDTHLGHWRHLNERRGSNCIDLGALSLLNCSLQKAPHLCATPCRRSCARAAGGAVIGRHRASVPGTESSHKFTLFTPPACARRRNVHQSCRYSQVHTRRRSLARMSRPLMRAISADAMLRRAGAAVARHPPPQKSANFCRLFGVWRRGGRRAPGTFPQVILTRHADLPRSREQCRHKR